MAITVSEKYRGRRMDVGNAELIYLVMADGADAGTLTDADAFSAVADSVSDNHEGIPVANVEVRSELIQGTVWEVAAVYSNQPPVIYQQATTEYEFSYQAPCERIYRSLRTVGVYSPSTSYNVNSFGGAINVVNDDGNMRAEGIDLPGGNITSTWTYQPLPGTSLRSSYEGDVESVMGDVASTPFFGRPYGTMRFVACQGGTKFSVGTNPKTFIRFGFQFSRNYFNQVNTWSDGTTTLTITVPQKLGHHLEWGFYEKQYHTQLKASIPVPTALIVEQVFNESNLRSVLGFG